MNTVVKGVSGLLATFGAAAVMGLNWGSYDDTKINPQRSEFIADTCANGFNSEIPGRYIVNNGGARAFACTVMPGILLARL